jgi:hypothetical protein
LIGGRIGTRHAGRRHHPGAQLARHQLPRARVRARRCAVSRLSMESLRAESRPKPLRAHYGSRSSTFREAAARRPHSAAGGRTVAGAGVVCCSAATFAFRAAIVAVPGRTQSPTPATRREFALARGTPPLETDTSSRTA